MTQCPVILPNGSQCPCNVSFNGLCYDHLHYRHKTGTGFGFNLIVKNEQDNLEKTLSNIRTIADEIVITDTGSTDRTVEIALEYADKVLYHEWQNSFSEARNWGLPYSSTKYVCTIDADEWLVNPDSVHTTLSQHPDTMAFLCPIDSEMPYGRVARHYLPKIFRNQTAHFEGIVHNQLIHAQPMIATDITFRHSGYNASEDVMEKKRNRTSTLLCKQIDKDPENTFAMMNLARTIRNTGDLDEVIRITDKALALETQPTGIRQMLLDTKILTLQDLGEYDKAEDVIREGLCINPHNLDYLFLLCITHSIQERHIDVIQAVRAYEYERLRQVEYPIVNNLLMDFWEAGCLKHEVLGHAYMGIGKYEDALQELRQALVWKPYDKPLWQSYLQCCQEMGDVEGAVMEAKERGVL